MYIIMSCNNEIILKQLCNKLPNELKFEILIYLHNNTFIYTFECLQIKQKINNELIQLLKDRLKFKIIHRYHPSLSLWSQVCEPQLMLSASECYIFLDTDECRRLAQNPHEYALNNEIAHRRNLLIL